jgi:hypothetical protein
MFADAIVKQKLDGFEREIGWRPVEHSIEEVDRWAARLTSVFPCDDKGNIYQSRSLTKEEAQFIANERAMCVASCFYFLTRYYWIQVKTKVIRFSFRQGQWILWSMLCWLDEQGFSKELQILKARQLGISTLAEGIMLWMALCVPGSKLQIGSADGQKTQFMLEMLTFAKDRISDLYPWLPPDETRSKRASDRPIINFEKVGSTIMVQHGAMRGGMAQGATPTGAHLSEVSQYVDPVKKIDEGLLRGLHADPSLVVLLESTGDATHRSAWWWKKNWIWNRDHFWKGEARMLPVFLPWHTTPELYPGESWIWQHPVPENFQPHQETLEHVQRCEAYVRCTPMLSKIMGEEWTMPLEQQWFWQFNYDEAKGKGTEKSWIRQMPGDDYEALIGEREKVVGEGTLEVMRNSQAEHSGVLAYSLVGDGVPEKYEPPPTQVWYGEESPPRLKCSWVNVGGEKFNWMWVPLTPVLEEKFDPLGKCVIYEEPREGFDYSMGWDTGTGVGGDRSIINVTRYGMDADPDVQVAEYASDNVSLDDIYIYGCALAAFYAKYMRHQHPKICIEQRRKYGDRPFTLARHGMGFTRQHKWGQGFDRKTREGKKIGPNPREGWFTNEWSRPMLLTAFLGAVENGWYVVKSKALATEIAGMEQRITDSGKTRMDHESGEHDDRVFAAAMAYFTLHRHDVMASRLKKRYDTPQGSGIVIQKGPASHTIVIPGSKKWQQAL